MLTAALAADGVLRLFPAWTWTLAQDIYPCYPTLGQIRRQEDVVFKPKLALFAVLFVTVSACGSSQSDPANDSSGPACDGSPASVDFTGKWTSDYDFNGPNGPLPATVIYEITQTGDDLSGVFSSTSGVEGTLTGKVSGNSACGTIDQTTAGCTGSFSFTAVLTGEKIEARVTGSDCSGAYSGDQVWNGEKL